MVFLLFVISDVFSVGNTCTFGRFIVLYRYMKIKQTLTVIALVAGMFGGVLAYAPTAFANNPTPIQVDNANGAVSSSCGGADTSFITCTEGATNSTRNNGVWALLIMALNILTAAVGVAAVGGIAYGAALYASAADAPDRAKKGMEFIKNVVIGLIAYGLMFVILNFLIPGGIFSN
jgi:hypothetical protein